MYMQTAVNKEQTTKTIVMNTINPNNLIQSLDNTFEYEIYTKDPVSGQTGWDIERVAVVAGNRKEAKEILKSYPNFDCIITVEYDAERGY